MLVMRYLQTLPPPPFSTNGNLKNPKGVILFIRRRSCKEVQDLVIA